MSVDDELSLLLTLAEVTADVLLVTEENPTVPEDCPPLLVTEENPTVPEDCPPLLDRPDVMFDEPPDDSDECTTHAEAHAAVVGNGDEQVPMMHWPAMQQMPYVVCALEENTDAKDISLSTEPLEDNADTEDSPLPIELLEDNADNPDKEENIDVEEEADPSLLLEEEDEEEDDEHDDEPSEDTAELAGEDGGDEGDEESPAQKLATVFPLQSPPSSHLQGP